MDYEQKYKNALEWARQVMNGETGFIRKEVEEVFPELKENHDELIKDDIKDVIQAAIIPKESKQEMLEWLEKQGKFDKSLYIRFGDIPINGKSKIYNGEIETGIEEGISVYPAFEDKEGNVILGLNLPITKTSLHTQQYLLEYDSRPCYLVTGDYVGKGTDGEPLLKNVRIIKEIKPYRIKQDKENNTYVINNTPNCGISVHTDEELKENVEKPQGKSAFEAVKEGKKVDNANKVELKDYNTIDPHFLKPIDFKAEHFYVSKVDGQIHDMTYNSANKIEPKFKVGDWITNGGANPCYVKSIFGNYYELCSCEGFEYEKHIIDVNCIYHLWSINDANDGDVLVNGSNIFIFNFINDTRLMGYCHVNTDNGRFYDDIGRNECFCLIDAEVTPATKEQHDLLFQKMKEAGYEWDNEKKELPKIVDKSSWSEEDERNLKGIIDEIEANKNSAPDYDLATYDRFLYWLKSLKQRIGG